MKWNCANCMGYAFKQNKWLCPTDWDNQDINYTAEMLTHRFHVQRIKKSEMVLGKEYIVMRIGGGDFHFARRSKDGHWRHKMGLRPVCSISEREIFSAKMAQRYTSTPIVFEVL